MPFQDLARLHGSIKAELDRAVSDVITSSAFVGAQTCEEFEAAFATAHQQPYAVGVGSGTDALALALRALGIGPGHEVVVPGMTFVASAEAIVHVGAVPVIADIDPETLLLDPASLEAAFTERTAAVIPVHLFGHVVPFDQIEAWKSKGLKVIEDAAQAHLATWREKPVGSAGDVACFSFYPGKNLGGFGDGGAIVTRNMDLAARVAKIRDHGRTSKYIHDEIGWCSRLDGLQAAVLNVKLGHLPAWTARRRQLADRYRKHLGDHLVPWEEGAVHHLLVMRVEPGDRDRIRQALIAQGIGVGIHYPVALTRQPSLSPYVRQPCPHSEAAAASVLSLPIDPLMDLWEVDLVCDVVMEVL